MPAPAASSRHAAGGTPYLLAWIGLLLLTGTSFGAHYLPLGPWATPVALLIAVGKAAIVLIVFMHVRQEAPSIRFIALVNALWVTLICVGIVGDIVTR